MAYPRPVLIRLVAFGAVLTALFGAGALVGDLTDAGGTTESAPEEHTEMSASTTHALHGLAVADGGLRVVVDDPELRRGRTERLSFRIVDERGATVRDFDVEQEKQMHLIVARRDLTGFQHLHPEQRADGAWTTTVRIDDAGSYRLFADFSRGGEARTLASDLRVDGAADLRPLPPPQADSISDGGYDVRLDAGAVRPGEETDLRFSVAKDGAPVRTDRYLGAGGHLVALREGDLAYLHVHPTDEGDAVGFDATFPTAGRYRLFLQFKHAGRVQTAAFTLEVR
jgi:hypothetical protein